MIILYVKTHNKTGLKYLGKTTRDPHKYPGSGLHWKRHLKKHGNDVKTEILYQTECEKDFREKALYYSDLFNIVDSKEWANMREETGHGGFTKEAAKKGLITMLKSGAHAHGKNGFNSEKARLAQKKSTEKKRKLGTLNAPKSEEHRKKISQTLKDTHGAKQEIIMCPNCRKRGGARAMKRWHFENCKLGMANGEPARS